MKSLKEMTVQELKTHIRGLTEKANKTINIINTHPTRSKAIETELNTLRKQGIIGKSGKAVLGFKGKTKVALVQQARELEYFSQWKGTETKAVRDKTNKAKFKSFIKNNPQFADYSYEEWRELVEIMGSAENLVDSFGYENLKQLHKEATVKNSNVDFAKIMRETLKQTKGTGSTQEDVINIFRSLLFK